MTLSWKQATEIMLSLTEQIGSKKLPESPQVSVLILTYNNENYIRRSIDSVLAQETDFPFEIIVGDDCSSDATTAIVKDFQKKFPKRIKLVLSLERLGQYTGNGKLNLIRSINCCKGEFLAFLCGDDYWCDSSKLQRQVSLMKNDSSIMLACHRVQYLYEKGSMQSHADNDGQEKKLHPNISEQSEFLWQKLFFENHVQTCSVVLRKKVLDPFPQWMLWLAIGDLPIWIYACTKGRVFYEPSVSAVYRIHPASYWSSQPIQARITKSRRTLRRTFQKTLPEMIPKLSGHELYNVTRFSILRYRLPLITLLFGFKVSRIQFFELCQSSIHFSVVKPVEKSIKKVVSKLKRLLGTV